jgi:hypothetical protein
MHDAMIAAWDTKYAYNRPRPAEIAAQLTTLVGEAVVVRAKADGA